VDIGMEEWSPSKSKTVLRYQRELRDLLVARFNEMLEQGSEDGGE
jgi:hypothetical protein